MKNGYAKGVAGWIAGRQREPRRIEQDYRRVRAALRSLGRGVTFLMAWSVPMAALAAEASLAWDGVAHPEVTGYYLHYGMASRSYSYRVPVGNVTSYTVSSLVSGQKYYFAVTAHNAELAESPYSNEVSTVVAGVAASLTTLASSPSPSAVGASVTFAATVTGNAPGGTLAFRDGGSTIGGCGTVTLTGTGNTRSATCTASGLAVGTHSVTAHYSGDAGNAASASAVLAHIVQVSTPAVPPAESASGLAWIDDALPAGAQADGSEPWDWVSNSPAPFAGRLAHQSWPSAGLHQHWFTGATATLTVAAGDVLFAYVYLDPQNPPREVMLQWNDGTWEHRAYWGANLIPWGLDGTASRRHMGPLPPTGQWVKLEIPASQIGLEGRIVSGMAFTLYDGRAAWDAAGSSSPGPAPTCGLVSAMPSGSLVWMDDALPAGAQADGSEPWNWVSNSPAPFAGRLAHQSMSSAGPHQHWFTGATATLAVAPDDVLFAYVYLDPQNPPREVMLQWDDGTWEHRAYWGANLIPWGVDGTASRRYVGPLPPTGQWVKLEVPASQVGLEGRIVSGMAFTLYDGRAAWDYAGIRRP